STSTASGTGQDNPYSGFLMDSMMDPVPWHSGIPFEPLNDAIMRTTISDEYGKLNLNALLQAEGDGQPAERDALVETLTNFFRYRAPDSETPPEAIVDAILDWLDYDDEDEERPEGAEMEYYEGLEIPYACKNGPMDSIEELLLIKGMTPELYYGNVEEEQLPLSEYLTVHGDWQGRININTAQLDLLQSVFEANGGDPALAAEIYETVRTEQPYTDAGQVQGLLPEQQAAEEEEQLRRQQQRRQDPQAEQEQRRNRTSSVFTVSSNAFRIYGDGMFEETLVRIEAYVYRGGAAGGGGGEDGAAPSEEPFRVLAWNVIR
ncbi:MAG: general secretion pathway protein GspK, partial [Candidatus Hydrogenedentes bacterium]|nr:general secretion pathway protein GspK [Candidatus Hydrogenedentota bacterium]